MGYRMDGSNGKIMHHRQNTYEWSMNEVHASGFWKHLPILKFGWYFYPCGIFSYFAIVFDAMSNFEGWRSLTHTFESFHETNCDGQIWFAAGEKLSHLQISSNNPRQNFFCSEDFAPSPVRRYRTQNVWMEWTYPFKWRLCIIKRLEHCDDYYCTSAFAASRKILL